MGSINDMVNDHNTMSRTGQIGHYANPKEFFREINYLMKLYDLPFNKIGILVDTADGEDWIMIDGHWNGDLDEWFYECLAGNYTKDEYLLIDTDRFDLNYETDQNNDY